MNSELKRAVRNIRLKGAFLRGLLGDYNGNIDVPARPGYYYVRVEKPGGYEVGIFPGRVRALYNLPVRVETHPVTGVQFIAGLDDETIVYSGTPPETIPAMERHALTHAWGGDDMLMWLHTQQLFPLRCQPDDTAPTGVVIQAGTYFAEGVFCVLQNPLAVDLAAYFPAAGHKYILLYLNAAGVAGVVDDGAARLDELGVAPGGTYWVAALRLAAGGAIGWQQIVDLRLLNSGVINGGELILGEDHIIIGTGHPDVCQPWVRLGRIANFAQAWPGQGLRAALGCAEVSLVVFSPNAGVYDVALAMRQQDVDDKLRLAFIREGGGLDDVLIAERDGTLTPAPGATFDGVDVSEHRHSGAPGDGPAFPFFNLSDVLPASYAGQAGRVVTVNQAETGLIFTEGGGGGGAEQLPIHRWHVDGALAVAAEVDGVWIVQHTFIPAYVWLYCETPGSAGVTSIDIEKSTNNGVTWASLFAGGGDNPALAFNAGRVVSGAADAIPLCAGTLLRCNITQVADDAANASVQFAPLPVQPAGGLLAIMGVG